MDGAARVGRPGVREAVQVTCVALSNRYTIEAIGSNTHHRAADPRPALRLCGSDVDSVLFLLLSCGDSAIFQKAFFFFFFLSYRFFSRLLLQRQKKNKGVPSNQRAGQHACYTARKNNDAEPAKKKEKINKGASSFHALGVRLASYLFPSELSVARDPPATPPPSPNR